jgi:hypothetical protein
LYLDSTPKRTINSHFHSTFMVFEDASSSKAPMDL